MADISKSEIKKEIAAILKDADLDKTSSKKEKEIDDLVMEYVESQQEEEDEDKSEQSEEEKKPAKKPAPAKKRKESEDEDQEDIQSAESEGKNPRRVAAGKKAASKMGHEKLSEMGKKGAQTRRSGRSSRSASEEEDENGQDYSLEEGELEGKNPRRVAAGKKAAESMGSEKLSEAGRKGGRRSGRTSRSGTSSDEGSRSSSEEGHVKDPKRVAAAKKAAETRKRRAQEAKEKEEGSAEEESGEPENKKHETEKDPDRVARGKKGAAAHPNLSEAGRKGGLHTRKHAPRGEMDQFLQGGEYDETKDPDFKPGQEDVLIEEEEETPRNPKQEEQEALREIQEQGRQMGIDPNKPISHETRTGLHYPTDKDKVTQHKGEYVEKAEEDVPTDEESEEEESEEEKPKKRAPPKKPAAKKKKAASDSEEESDASESGSDDDYRPSKGSKKKGKKGKAGKKKKGSDSDEGSDEDWKASKAKKSGGIKTKLEAYEATETVTAVLMAKKGGGGGGRGYARPLKLSPELSELVGEESAPRHEVVKRVWALIKERNLYDPKNKQFAICDDQFYKVFGVKRFRTFGMMKLLKDHFITE